jgi:hypothetical protein
LLFPAHDAVMLCEPAASNDVVKVAVFPEIDPVPIELPPS